ncbi:MAG: primosomal protein N' [Dehalococcoidia bacterium]|nr:primosomal protein N' [Dehalococcoidia bacterium]
MDEPGAKERFAEVAVNTGQPVRMGFSYRVPEGVSLVAGQAVFVPFGPRILQGIVLGLTCEEPSIDGIRDIEAVADPDPVLDRTHIELARWLSDTYVAPLWESVAVSLPGGYGQRAVTMVSPVDIPPLLPVYPRDQRVLQYIAANGRVSFDQLKEAVPGITLPRLRRLQAAGHLTVAQGLSRPAGRPKTERRLELQQSAGAAQAHAAQLKARQPRSVDARLLERLAVGGTSLTEARELGATPAHVRRLEGDGWIREFELRIERDPLADYRFDPKPAATLSVGQQAVADAIWASPGMTHLIRGVTGSGKTEVYLDLVGRTLAAGKSAIVLVPEIALTPQAIRRYGERYGETLTVLHSHLGAGELYDQWYRIQRGDARVVLGSRSAIFAPMYNPGLIILDEEHEWTYKQVEHQPRYHAREVAEELSRLTGATVVLGSATPDIVTFHRAVTGMIGLHELDERLAPAVGGGTRPGQLPQVAVIDMREELKGGNRSVFSVPLKRAIKRALIEGEQSILFVNRRGSARFMLCRDCGYIPICSSCQVAMSLDLREQIHARLVCHHCGRAKRLEDRCPRCDSGRYRPFGVGTQRIEQEARAAFPDARVARWDSDVSKQKGSHERMVRSLEAGEIDILVGTQMLAKGLDLPEMTVVGVVDADVGMSLPDYHASERTFQVLSQVAGRAGRRDKPGYVFIQTYDPESPPVQCAAEHDYRAFYEVEIAHRRRAGYPPFARMTRLLYRHLNQEHAVQEASRVAGEIRLARDAAGRAEPDVLGPTPAYIARVKGEYRYQVVLRGRNPATILSQVRLGERWAVDVDPVSLV